MRMWMVDPGVMCRMHLQTEHSDLHALTRWLRKGIDLSGFIENGLVDLSRINERHDAIVAEFARRGWKHSTPMGRVFRQGGSVNRVVAMSELFAECSLCRNRIKE